MTLPKTGILLSLLAWLLIAVSCDRSVVTGSRLTPSNYDQITTGMTKAQVERILGPPTTVETKDMMIFKKPTYRDRSHEEISKSRYAFVFWNRVAEDTKEKRQNDVATQSSTVGIEAMIWQYFSAEIR